MTREEIIEAIQHDNMMPFLQDWEVRDVVDFVLKNIQPSLPKGLEEAAEEYIKKGKYLPEAFVVKPAFIAGAEWQKEKDARDMYMSDNRHFQKVYELGKKDMRKEMMEKAEECELYWDGDFLAIDLNMAALGYSERDKVKVIIFKTEEK